MTTEKIERGASVRRRTGLAVCRLRVVQGLTQVQLAETAGLSVSYIGRLERGLCDPTLLVMEKLSDALSVTLSDLLGHVPVER